MKVYKFWNFLYEFGRLKAQAKAIKADPEKQPKSKRFGISSVFASLLGVGFSFVIVFGIKWLMSDNLWLIIAGAVIGLIGLAGTVSAIYKGIESWGFQLYINKRPITWISLIILLLSIAAIVVIFALLI